MSLNIGIAGNLEKIIYLKNISYKKIILSLLNTLYNNTQKMFMAFLYAFDFSTQKKFLTDYSLA